MWQGWVRGSHHSISNDRGLNDGSSSPGLMIFVIPAVTKIWALQKKFRHVFSCWYSLQGWFSSLLLWYIVFYLIFFNKVLFWGSKYIYIIWNYTEAINNSDESRFYNIAWKNQHSHWDPKDTQGWFKCSKSGATFQEENAVGTSEGTGNIARRQNSVTKGISEGSEVGMS